MSKKWMGVLVLLALFAVPATYAGGSESSSNPIVQIMRQIFTRVSAMIPPTGNPAPSTPGNTP